VLAFPLAQHCCLHRFRSSLQRLLQAITSPLPCLQYLVQLTQPSSHRRMQLCALAMLVLPSKTATDRQTINLAYITAPIK
jgi:hypothetical protein